MSEYTAAVALSSFDEFDETRKKWKILNDKARGITKSNSLTFLEPLSSQSPSIYWNIEIPNTNLMDKVTQILMERGIETRKWWPIATHTLRFFSQANLGNTEYPQSTYRAQSTLGLPLHLLMTDSDFERISAGLAEVARYLQD
jgi:dTDP-4-amino-4,6-dideoxygalactose transaminase